LLPVEGIHGLFFRKIPDCIGAHLLEYFVDFRSGIFLDISIDHNSRTVGPRGLVSEAMLLNFKRRVECR